MLRRRRNQGLLHRPETSPNHQPDTTTARSGSRICSTKSTTCLGFMAAVFSRFDAHIIKASRTDRPDETINVDLPVYFLYHTNHKRWLIIKGPMSKNYEEAWYDAIEKRIEMMPNPYDNIVTWVEFLKRVCWMMDILPFLGRLC